MSYRVINCALALVGLLLSGSSTAGLVHIEPPHWWRGMHSSELQIMLHGNSISHLQVELVAEGATVQRVERRANPNYLWLYLQLQPTGSNELHIELRDPTTAKVVEQFRYALLNREEGSAHRAGFSAKDLIYLITPDRFANGDTRNDSLPQLLEQADRANPDGRHGGDLLGIEQNLDYLASLGVGQIWLNPIQENNQPNYSYHGYSVTDLYSVDARLGGNQALEQLTSAAAKRGIGFIMDSIPNHVGSEHWWMQDLPTPTWVNGAGQAYVQTTHRRETIQDPYAADIDIQEFSDGWFVPTMPDLNQREPLLADYLIQNALWWIETARLSGLRVDTLPYSDKEFTRAYMRRILTEYPRLNIVGEEWTTNPSIVAYWQLGQDNHDDFDAGVPSLMDFPTQAALIAGLREPQTAYTGIVQLYRAIANDFLYPDPNNLVLLADNHDMSRIYTQLDEDPRKLKIALVLMATLRGIPQLFYGTEIAMSNGTDDAHGVIRSDFPGGWPHDTESAFAGKGLSPLATSTLAFTQKLFGWRKSASMVHSGQTTHFAPVQDHGVYVFARYNQAATALVLVNASTTEHSVDWSRYAQVIGTAKSARAVLNDETVIFAERFDLQPLSAVILEYESGQPTAKKNGSTEQ